MFYNLALLEQLFSLLLLQQFGFNIWAILKFVVCSPGKFWKICKKLF